ncbi:MAG: tellurite resistance TerB family protein [Candidatus Electrothrix sp. Rat3]|nr:tellurite resistance TerB family protein [Candidatus Electrothrix rattekaaiensis]
MAERNWGSTGERMVNSSADFVSGVGSAFKGIGNRFKRRKFEPFAEALCAVVGDVASQNGRLYKDELEAFRKFLLHNCRNTPILEMFKIDELVKKMERYAVSAFLCDEETVLLAVKKVEEPELADLVILCALAVALADGDCDAKEQDCIEHHARNMRVDVRSLAGQFNLNFGSDSKPQIVPPAVPPPQQVAPPPKPHPAPAGGATATDTPCPMCKGAGGSCVFCKGTGRK